MSQTLSVGVADTLAGSLPSRGVDSQIQSSRWNVIADQLSRQSQVVGMERSLPRVEERLFQLWTPVLDLFVTRLKRKLKSFLLSNSESLNSDGRCSSTAETTWTCVHFHCSDFLTG